jgi:hypothetical protein
MKSMADASTSTLDLIFKKKRRFSVPYLRELEVTADRSETAAASDELS